MEAIFARCLPITTDVEICRTYVLYVRRVNDVITGGEKARSTVVSAFDFATNKVGTDVDSSDLWKDYLDFFKSWTPGSSWEQQQKNDLIRKLYRRCLVIPNSRIEAMWSEYTKWENEVSTPNSASKFIADLSTSYMEARSWNTEWHNTTKNLIRRKLVPISIQDDPNNTAQDQLALWFKWIDLEKKNGLNLKDYDLQNRIEYVYKRAVSMLPFVPEIWYRYAQYMMLEKEDDNRQRAIDLLVDGVRLNPRSFLLSFKLSELHEKDAAFSKAQEVLDNLIKVLSEDHSGVQSRIDHIKANLAHAKRQPAKEPSIEPDTKMNSDSEDDEDNQPVVQYTESEALKILELESKLEESNKAVTLVYIQLMALCKRSQGIKEVRSVFKQRKNFKSMGYEFYVENALIEFYSDNKKIADKVFDLAMKSFSKNGGFLYAYLDYLILTNAIDSLKVFLEVALTNLLKEVTSDKETLQLATKNILEQRKRQDRLKQNEHYMRKIMRKYIKYASNYLDLDTVLSLEKRYTQYFPSDDDIALFADRYKAAGLDGIAKYDLGESATLDLDDEEEEKDNTRARKRRKTAKADNYSPESTGARNTPEAHGGKNNSALTQLQPQHGFVGNSIYNLLLVLPNAGYFGPVTEHVFSSAKLVELFGNLSALPGET